MTIIFGHRGPTAMKNYLLIKEVSKEVGVPVGTLLYYDKIGLLKPATRSSSGYRLYSRENLERLFLIIFLKSLGFKIADIKVLLQINISSERVIASLSKQMSLLQTQVSKIMTAENILASAISQCSENKNVDWLSLQKQRDDHPKDQIKWSWWAKEGLSPDDQQAFTLCKKQLKEAFRLNEDSYGCLWSNLLLEVRNNLDKSPRDMTGKMIGARAAGLLNMMYGEDRRLAWVVYQACYKRDNMERDFEKWPLASLLIWLELALVFHKLYPLPEEDSLA